MTPIRQSMYDPRDSRGEAGADPGNGAVAMGQGRGLGTRLGKGLGNGLGKGAGIALAALLLASCGTVRDVVGLPGGSPRSSPAPAPAPAPNIPAMRGYPDRFDGSFNGYCQQREDDGFQERATLRITNRQVQTLNWRSVIGRKGSCQFDLGDFRQTKNRPHLELLANDGSGCKLMIYQDARRVTLAHAACQKRCTPGVYDQAWPVMFDPASGQCAALDK